MPEVSGTYTQSPPQIKITVTDGGGGDRYNNTQVIVVYDPTKLRYLRSVAPRPTKHLPRRGVCIWLAQTIGIRKEFRMGFEPKSDDLSTVRAFALKVTKLGVSRGSASIRVKRKKAT